MPNKQPRGVWQPPHRRNDGSIPGSGEPQAPSSAVLMSRDGFQRRTELSSRHGLWTPGVANSMAEPSSQDREDDYGRLERPKSLDELSDDAEDVSQKDDEKNSESSFIPREKAPQGRLWQGEGEPSSASKFATFAHSRGQRSDGGSTAKVILRRPETLPVKPSREFVERLFDDSIEPTEYGLKRMDTDCYSDDGIGYRAIALSDGTVTFFYRPNEFCISMIGRGSSVQTDKWEATTGDDVGSEISMMITQAELTTLENARREATVTPK